MDDVAGGDGVSGVDFSDEKKAHAWLEKQSVKVRCAIACRAALRVSANICRIEGGDFPTIALPVFRATLTSAVRGSGRVRDVDWLRSAASTVAFSTAYTAASSAAYSAAYSVAFVASSASSAAHSVVSSASSAAAYSKASVAASSAAYSAASLDSANADISGYDCRLWHELGEPSGITQSHAAFVWLLSEDLSTWGFWHDWYLAMWEGWFTDWNLAIEVAKIPDDVWEQGAEAVAAEIAKIKARRALEAEIASLKAQLRQAHAVEVPAHRLHNNPPEAIENDQQLRSEITLIWELLEIVETEITKPAPSPAVLRGIADRLWEISQRIAKYCGSLADVAVKESAKVIGKTGTKAGIAWYLTDMAPQNEGIKAVAKAAWEFAKTLPSG